MHRDILVGESHRGRNTVPVMAMDSTKTSIDYQVDRGPFSFVSGNTWWRTFGRLNLPIAYAQIIKIQNISKKKEEVREKPIFPDRG